MAPVGGQSQFNLHSQSRCKRVHGWFDKNQVYRIAFLCERHLYVLTGGTLVDISPTSPLVSPTPVGAGGYGDGVYNSDDPYGSPRDITLIAAQDKIPSWYSLDNFGSILYAMTSADGRLLEWDPAGGGAAALQAADSGRGPVPNGRGFVVTNERYIMMFATGRRHGRGRQAEPLRVVRSGEPWRVGLYQRHQPGGLSRHRAVRVRSSARRLTRNGVIIFTAKKAYQFRISACPTSTTTSSWARHAHPGRRRASPRPLR